MKREAKISTKGKRGQKGSGKEARQFNAAEEAYIDWLSTPPEFYPEDEATSIVEYAKKHKINRRTLYNYSIKDGFWEEVEARYKKHFAYKNLRVDQALYKKAVGIKTASVTIETGERDGKTVDIERRTDAELAPDTAAIELHKEIHDKYQRKLNLKIEGDLLKRWNDAARRSEVKK